MPVVLERLVQHVETYGEVGGVRWGSEVGGSEVGGSEVGGREVGLVWWGDV